MALHLIPETVIERGEHWIIATNLNQNLIGRLIVVAARDVDSVTALSADEWQGLHRHIGRTRVALDALFQPEQYNYAFLMNQDAQLHLHVVPRYAQPRQWAGEIYDDPHFGSIFGTDSELSTPSVWPPSPTTYANSCLSVVTCPNATRHQRADRLLVPLTDRLRGQGGFVPTTDDPTTDEQGRRRATRPAGLMLT